MSIKCLLCHEPFSQSRSFEVCSFAKQEPSRTGTYNFPLVSSDPQKFPNGYTHEKCAALSIAIPHCIHCGNTIKRIVDLDQCIYFIPGSRFGTGQRDVVFRHIDCPKPASLTSKGLDPEKAPSNLGASTKDAIELSLVSKKDATETTKPSKQDEGCIIS